MNIDFSQNICNLEGEVITDEKGTPFTLRTATVNALLANSEKEITAEEKVKRFLLASKIQHATEDVSLTIEEVAEIKKVIGAGYGTLIVGQAFALLEK